MFANIQIFADTNTEIDHIIPIASCSTKVEHCNTAMLNNNSILNGQVTVTADSVILQSLRLYTHSSLENRACFQELLVIHLARTS